MSKFFATFVNLDSLKNVNAIGNIVPNAVGNIVSNAAGNIVSNAVGNIVSKQIVEQVLVLLLISSKLHRHLLHSIQTL